ncbi:hypothetical protein CLOM_g2032 [Closterium sp. NIES-68]|nr:hypothetical protein CLOM_g18954 [Closterium sp. NIES-68]GJP42475.1 hypothetical protein CLOM_g2032 [Closterium sp. NIES-68]GJP67696.1 hypothetical protein CLOP_g24487 [Closterium sp. NIES-67]
MPRFHVPIVALVLVSALVAANFSDVNAQSYMAIKAAAARKTANDAEAVTNAALAEYNTKLKAEQAIQKLIDDANAALVTSQTNLANTKKQLDDARTKAEKARQEMIKFRSALQTEQDYHDELEQQAHHKTTPIKLVQVWSNYGARAQEWTKFGPKSWTTDGVAAR